jgi:hypothetical protein
MINLELSPSDSFTNLKVTLLLESLTSGQVTASIREFPDCRVQAETRETTIASEPITSPNQLPRISGLAMSTIASEPITPPEPITKAIPVGHEHDRV